VNYAIILFFLNKSLDFLGYDTVNLLIHYYPQLLVQVKPTIQQSVLHIAIAKQDIAGKPFNLCSDQCDDAITAA